MCVYVCVCVLCVYLAVSGCGEEWTVFARLSQEEVGLRQAKEPFF